MALDDASDREQVFDILLRAARSKARFAALLSVHADHIRGRRAIADDGLDTSRVDTLRIERNTVPAFEAAIASRTASVGPITSGEPFVDGLLALVGGGSPSVLILPVAVGARTVALVLAHRGDDAIALDDVGDLLPLVTASNPALARVLAARSRATTTTKPSRGDTRNDASGGYIVEVIVPDAAKKRAALDAHRTAAAWDELADAIRELVRDGMDSGDPDEDEQLALLLELGRVEAERLGRPERAIEAWQSAQTIDASDVRVLDALQALFVQQGRWIECTDLIEKRVALAEELPERIGLLLELATMARERLDDDERAIAAYERILAWEPHDVAWRALEEIYSSHEQWEPLAALLLDRASRHEDAQTSIAALEAVAQMYETKVGDARAAFLVWLAVVRRDPDRDDLIEQLDRLGPATAAWDEIVAECRSLADELEADHPEAAARVWQLVGRWARDHLANRDDAAAALDRAFRLTPGDRDRLAELVDLLRGDGRWLELTALLSQRADVEPDLARRSELHAELGDVYDAQLHQPAEAIAAYERALVDEPESTPALIALHRLYLATEAWEPLAGVLPRLIDTLDPATERGVVVDLHVELGTVLADHLGRSDDAVKAFNAALALEPKHAAAFAGISRVYQATGQTEALLDATEAELDAKGRADQLVGYGEVATAWHARARFDRAAACWQKLLDLEPTSAGAAIGLARAFHDAQQWGSFVAAQRAALQLVTTPGQRIALLVDLAGVLESRLDDLDGAIAAHQDVIALDANHRGSLDALAQLYDRAGRLQPALDVLQRLLELTKDPVPRADLFARIGHAHLNARDITNARLNLSQAITLDLDSASAHEGMARVHLQQDELVPAGEELIRAAELSASQHDRIRCLADAAWVFRHRLRDIERARQCLSLILDLEPEHADAKQALAELLHDAQQWETLWPHLEEQVARVKADASVPATERLDVFQRAARCAVELGQFGTAMELYDLACTLDPSPATQIERAEALYRSKSLDAAAAAFHTIVLRHAQALEPAQLVAVYRRLAEIHTALGKASQAQLFHQKVLDLEPTHRATLQDLAELHVARGRFDEAIASLRVIATIAPVAERVAVLERIGDLYRDKQKNAPRAMSTYLEALELDATSRRLLQRLLDLQSAAGQWKAAVETIGRFLEHETDPARRAAYYLASAEIRRTELKDKTGAIECFEDALDELFREQPLADATRTRGFEVFRTITELISADRNWKSLEQSYRRMIRRAPKDDPALIQLWHALGEIYLTRLQHPQSAIEAFEVAHSLDADKSPQRARTLAELYAVVGKAQPAQVSGRAAKLVEFDPSNPDAYRALGRTSLEAGRVDEAWCVARALVFLKLANADEQALYRRYQTHETRKANGILDEDSWAFVRHPDEDRTISAIFALIWEGPVALRAGPAKSFELKPKDRMPVEDGTRVIPKIFRHAARVLNVALPDVYVQPRRPGRLLLANCLDKGRLAPSVIMGRDLMTGYRDTEIAASVGAMLAALRPAYYLKLALANVDELEAALVATAALLGKNLARPKLEPLIAAFAPEIKKRMTRPTAEALLALVNRLTDAPDLARWRAAIDTAAQRAGLLVCGELAAVARMVSSEAAAPGVARQRVQDLVAYSVSPGYFAARRHLGVAVG